MNKRWLIIFWLLLIIVVSILLLFLKPQEKINNVIQAIAIVTLVFVTLFYARQTQNLVAQEKESLDEEKKVRNASFGEKRLKEFFYPVLKGLKDLERLIEEPGIDYEPFSKTVRGLADLFMDSFHLSSLDEKKKITELNEILNSVSGDVERGKLKEETKEIILTNIDEVTKFLRNHMFEIEVNIEKVYEFFSG